MATSERGGPVTGAGEQGEVGGTVVPTGMRPGAGVGPATSVPAGSVPPGPTPPGSVTPGPVPRVSPGSAAYPVPVYGAPPPSVIGSAPVGTPAADVASALNPYRPPASETTRRRRSGRGAPGMPASVGQPPQEGPGAQHPHVAVAPVAARSAPGVVDAPVAYADPYAQIWTPSERPAGARFSVAALAFAALALFFLPPFFGAVAIVLASFGVRRGERLAKVALVGGVACLAGGMVLGAYSYTAGMPGF
jgi:hypothetical protein